MKLSDVVLLCVAFLCGGCASAVAATDIQRAIVKIEVSGTELEDGESKLSSLHAGTGFIVAKSDGEVAIVTAAHVLGYLDHDPLGFKDVPVWEREGDAAKRKISVYYLDEKDEWKAFANPVTVWHQGHTQKYDIAVLRVRFDDDDDALRVLSVGSSETITRPQSKQSSTGGPNEASAQSAFSEYATQAEAWGIPTDKQAHPAERVVANVIGVAEGSGPDLRLSNAQDEGMSGGPILIEGKVVGVLSAKSDAKDEMYGSRIELVWGYLDPWRDRIPALAEKLENTLANAEHRLSVGDYDAATRIARTLWTHAPQDAGAAHLFAHVRYQAGANVDELIDILKPIAEAGNKRAELEIAILSLRNGEKFRHGVANSLSLTGFQVLFAEDKTGAIDALRKLVRQPNPFTEAVLACIRGRHACDEPTLGSVFSTLIADKYAPALVVAVDQASEPDAYKLLPQLAEATRAGNRHAALRLLRFSPFVQKDHIDLLPTIDNLARSTGSPRHFLGDVELFAILDGYLSKRELAEAKALIAVAYLRGMVPSGISSAYAKKRGQKLLDESIALSKDVGRSLNSEELGRIVPLWIGRGLLTQASGNKSTAITSYLMAAQAFEFAEHRLLKETDPLAAALILAEASETSDVTALLGFLEQGRHVSCRTRCLDLIAQHISKLLEKHGEPMAKSAIKLIASLIKDEEGSSVTDRIQNLETESVSSVLTISRAAASFMEDNALWTGAEPERPLLQKLINCVSVRIKLGVKINCPGEGETYWTEAAISGGEHRGEWILGRVWEPTVEGQPVQARCRIRATKGLYRVFGNKSRESILSIESKKDSWAKQYLVFGSNTDLDPQFTGYSIVIDGDAVPINLTFIDTPGFDELQAEMSNEAAIDALRRMKDGYSLTVKYKRPHENYPSSDAFSLYGLRAAYREMVTSCKGMSDLNAKQLF